MPKFRKKPVVIEAVQFKRPVPNEHQIMPSEFARALCRCHEGLPPHIHTLEGLHTVSIDDWIIRGVKGEFYPCKPDIFEMTYEAVDD